MAQGVDGPVRRPGPEPVGPPRGAARAGAHGVRARRLLGPRGRVRDRAGVLGHARRPRRRPRRHRQGLRQPGPRHPRRRRGDRRDRGPVPGGGPRRVHVHGVHGRGAALPQLAQGPLHHLHPPAGGRAQAVDELPPGHAHRAGPLRAGLHHLHADRLGHAVRRGAGRGPDPGAGAVRRQVPALGDRASTARRSRTPRRPTRRSGPRATAGGPPTSCGASCGAPTCRSTT